MRLERLAALPGVGFNFNCRCIARQQAGRVWCCAQCVFVVAWCTLRWLLGRICVCANQSWFGGAASPPQGVVCSAAGRVAVIGEVLASNPATPGRLSAVFQRCCPVTQQPCCRPCCWLPRALWRALHKVIRHISTPCGVLGHICFDSTATDSTATDATATEADVFAVELCADAPEHGQFAHACRSCVVCMCVVWLWDSGCCKERLLVGFQVTSGVDDRQPISFSSGVQCGMARSLLACIDVSTVQQTRTCLGCYCIA